MQNLLALANPP